jgi:quinol monooxygenase YgiN
LNFPNKFVFYEVYKDEESIKKHKLTPHFALWSNFKNSGGVLSQSVTKASTVGFDYSAQKEHESQIWSIDQWKSWN